VLESSGGAACLLYTVKCLDCGHKPVLVTAGTATWEVTGNILPRSLRGKRELAVPGELDDEPCILSRPLLAALCQQHRTPWSDIVITAFFSMRVRWQTNSNIVPDEWITLMRLIMMIIQYFLQARHHAS